jgi:probable F420-dependent oxidoreductase
MRLGFNIPNLGPAASGEHIVRVAQKAEELGYDTVWATERLLFPTHPQTPYAGSPDGALPDIYKISLDPIESLTFVAAETRRIGLGTSVLDIPFYNPVLLARRLTTLDVVSGGRLRAGMGLGWSQDEYDATGATKNKGARADEFLQVLKAIWTTDPAEFKGKFFKLPKSVIQPKPAQKPHPPIYLAAFSPGAMKRVAMYADGWIPVGFPIDVMKQTFEQIRSMAKEAGRDPNKLELIVRANMVLSEGPLGEGRWPFTGSADEVRDDIKASCEAGVAEVHFDPSFSPAGQSVDGFLTTMEKVRELAG